ncbi:PaaI family thioesterase [Salipiger sp.]|uniref:PaaI family thioesterase n=1 Tax=Salipiger sp. TaxID=2078585 RepID=UPI003A97DB7F
MTDLAERPGAQDAPPEGFTQLTGRTAIESHIGPFYERRLEDGAWQLGFRVTTAKLNGMGNCHGGVLATFADIQGAALKKTIGLRVKSPTVSLSLDYVAPAPEGAWVQSTPEVVRETGRLLFFQALVTADGTPCLRASGIYKLERD